MLKGRYLRVPTLAAVTSPQVYIHVNKKAAELVQAANRVKAQPPQDLLVRMGFQLSLLDITKIE